MSKRLKILAITIVLLLVILWGCGMLAVKLAFLTFENYHQGEYLKAYLYGAWSLLIVCGLLGTSINSNRISR